MKTPLLFTLLLLAIVKTGLALEPHVLSGVVTNSRNGESISEVSIFVEDLKTGTISNQSGNYMLYLKEGDYKVVFSGKGFHKKEIEIKIDDDQELTVELTPDSKPKTKGKLKKE